MRQKSAVPKTSLDIQELSYTAEEQLCIKRLKRGRGYSFVRLNGSLIKKQKERKRLLEIAVPPSYQDVWYCSETNGHLQAIGYDSQGKKQYFYHPSWQALQDRKKFILMSEFGTALPSFRRKIATKLKSSENDKEKVLCALLRILDRTGMRIGSKWAARRNHTYGLTTLRRKHLKADIDDIHFEFSGKGGSKVLCTLHDPLVQKVVDACEEIPGQWLFDYRDKQGKPHHVHSQDVNDYIKLHMGSEFSAKDFRTWRFNCLFLKELLQHDESESITLKGTLETIAQLTCNTAAILKASYIHPALLDLCKNGGWDKLHHSHENTTYLRKHERYLLEYLRSGKAKTALRKNRIQPELE